MEIHKDSFYTIAMRAAGNFKSIDGIQENPARDARILVGVFTQA
jgi:hypothetical protein